MKTAITPAYVFNPAAGTLDLSAVPGFSIRRLSVVFNLTRSKPIYASGAEGYGFTSLAGGVIHLTSDTTGMAAGDELSILYDDPTSNPPPLGQALKAASVPVVLASDQGAISIAAASAANGYPVASGAGPIVVPGTVLHGFVLSNLSVETTGAPVLGVTFTGGAAPWTIPIGPSQTASFSSERGLAFPNGITVTLEGVAGDVKGMIATR